MSVKRSVKWTRLTRFTRRRSGMARSVKTCSSTSLGRAVRLAGDELPAGEMGRDEDIGEGSPSVVAVPNAQSGWPE
jgi:hypothetical protein